MMRIGIAGPISLDLLDYPLSRPHDLPGGYPAPITSHFANALLRRGHQVVVFTASWNLTEPVVINQGPLTVCVAPRDSARSALSFYARERRCLRGLIAEYPVDLVHAMWSYEFALAALQSNVPTIVHYRDHAWTVLRHARDPYRFVRWVLSQYVTSRAKYRVANSGYLKASFGRKGRDMIVIPNFLPPFPQTPSDVPDGRRPYICTVSNGFSGHKNVEVGLRAFDMLRREGVIGEYRLVGYGLGVGESGERFARDNGLAEGVRFVGSLPYERAIEQVRHAAALLHPSLEESFSMTILEAMALGTPVIAGRESGNVPSLLEGGACGRLCDVRDPRDCSRAVLAALTDVEETGAAVVRARNRYLERYSEDVVMAQVEALYGRTLSGRLPSNATSSLPDRDTT